MRGRDYFVRTDDVRPVFGERMSSHDGKSVRYLDPKRSKLAAAITKHARHFPFRENSKILYLGASSGTTVSYLSDICRLGMIYAVEISVDPFYKLLSLAERRKNIIPILEDANNPERYSFFVEDPDVIYQDIAQRNQVQIFNSNASLFSQIKYGVLVLKTRSISSRVSESNLLKDSVSRIEGFKVLDVVDLKPYDQSNYMVFLSR